MTHPFNDEELLMIFEAARVTFTNYLMCDEVADILDLSDAAVYAMGDKLQEFMGNNKGVEPKEQSDIEVAHLFPAQDYFVAGSYLIQEQDPMDTLHPFNYGIWLLVGPVGDKWAAILDYEKSREYSAGGSQFVNQCFKHRV